MCILIRNVTRCCKHNLDSVRKPIDHPLRLSGSHTAENVRYEVTVKMGAYCHLSTRKSELIVCLFVDNAIALGAYDSFRIDDGATSGTEALNRSFESLSPSSITL